MIVLKEPYEFLWDKGNSNKNFIKHRVTNTECEEVFLDNNKVIFEDTNHSTKEKRFILLGQTKKHRLLFVVFTIRKSKLRIISARDFNKKERMLYEKEIDNS